MTWIRRFFAGLPAAALLVASVVFASPAQASDVVIEFTCAPAQDDNSGEATPAPTPTPSSSLPGDRRCTPENGQVVNDGWTIAMRVEATGGSLPRLRRVELSILSEDPDVPSPGAGSDHPGRVAVWGDGEGADNWRDRFGTSTPRQRTLTYEWNTSTLTPYNGPYTIRVRAWSHNDAADSPSTAERKSIRVNNPPAAPAAPAIDSVNLNKISVKWSTAPEPDVVWYTLFRARTADKSTVPEADDFERIDGRFGETSMVDVVEVTGAYWYKVQVARRSGVTSSGAISSQHSASSDAAVVTELPATPAPDDEEARPRVTPRPIGGPRVTASRPVPVRRPPPLAPPTASVSPYGFDGDDLARDAQVFESQRERESEDMSRVLLPTAIGLFLLSSVGGLALRRISS